jgi:prepilin-type N-terminal cleavage/methylation domain-containing protein
MRNRTTKIRDEAGFTLTELMVTVAIFAIVLTAVYGAFTSQFNSYQTQEDVVTVQTDIRNASEMLTRDIRNAGFGVPTGGGVTAIAAASANSISLNLAGSTTSTYISSANYTVAGSSPGPYTYVVRVASTAGFQTGQKYNTIDIRTKMVAMGNGVGDQIILVGTNTLTLTGILNSNFVLTMGDLVVAPGFTPVTYVVSNCNGTTSLNRTDPVSGTCVLLSNNVQSFSLSYIMADGTTTTTPVPLANIAAVNFTINGGTTNTISNLNGQKRIRTVNSIVALRNF